MSAEKTANVKKSKTIWTMTEKCRFLAVGDFWRTVYSQGHDYPHANTTANRPGDQHRQDVSKEHLQRIPANMPRQVEGFNFVGLAHSPVKQTPSTRSYDRQEPDSKGVTGEPLSTARNAVDDSASSSCRTALQMVSNNVFNTPLNEKAGASGSKSSALLSSSTSGQKCEAVRSCVPVSRTLRLSPSAEVTAPGTMIDYYSENAGHEHETGIHRCDDNRGFPNHSRGSAVRFAALEAPTPSSRTKMAGIKTQRKQTSPASSPPPISLGDDLRHRANAEYHPQTPIAEEPCMSSSPWLGSCSHGSDNVKWSDNSFSNAMFSPIPATPAAPAAETTSGSQSGRNSEDRPQNGLAFKSDSGEEKVSHYRTSFSQPDSRRVGSTHFHASSSRDRPLAGSSVSCDYTDCTPASMSANVASSDPRSILQRSACEELDGKVKLDTPTAAATLAAMMGGSNGPATIPPVDGSEEEDGYSDEARDLFPEEPSHISMHYDQQVRSTDMVPESPLVSEKMTPRRPMAASALLELRDGTPRGMIRGIIAGGGQSGRLRHQQQHFQPQVAKVNENVEEETPRRFIKAVLASNSNNATAAVSNENSSGGESSSASVVAPSVAAATEAASNAAVTRAADAVPENVEPRRSVAPPVEETPAPVDNSSATVSSEDDAEVGLLAGVKRMGRALFNTVLFINAFAFLFVLVIVLMALTNKSFEDDEDKPVIY